MTRSVTPPETRVGEAEEPTSAPRTVAGLTAMIAVLREVVGEEEARHLASNCAQTIILMREVKDERSTEELLQLAFRDRKSDYPRSHWNELDGEARDALARRCAIAWETPRTE